MNEAYAPLTAGEPWPYYLGVVARTARTIVAAHRPGMAAHIDRCADQLNYFPEAALAEILSASTRSCDWAATHRPDDYSRFVEALCSLILPGGRLTSIGPDPIPVTLRADYWAGWWSQIHRG
ncbi:hypothetical protein J0H58_12590 [bacterium]|nr:hypothetical protein [bacterium]